MGSEPILYICISVTIDAMLNFDDHFDVDPKGEFTCKQGFELHSCFPPSGGIIMYGAFLLFESEFLHVVAITFTSLILTELLMVGLTVRTWHFLMVVSEILSLLIYVASIFILRDIFGKSVYSSTWRLYSSSGIYSVSQCTHLRGVYIHPPGYIR